MGAFVIDSLLLSAQILFGTALLGALIFACVVVPILLILQWVESRKEKRRRDEARQWLDEVNAIRSAVAARDDDPFNR